MIDLVKAAANVGVEYPLLAAPGDGLPDRLQRVVRRPPGPKPVAGGQEVGFDSLSDAMGLREVKRCARDASFLTGGDERVVRRGELIGEDLLKALREACEA